MAAWGDTSEEEEDSEDGEEVVALMTRTDSDSNSDLIESLPQLKEEVCNLSKRKLEKLVFILMEECEIVNSANCMLKNSCSGLEKDVKRLERKRHELEHMNEALMYEKLKINEKALALSKELDILEDLSDKKEEELNTKIRELESELSLIHI